MAEHGGEMQAGDVEAFRRAVQGMRSEIGRVIVGQEAVIDQILTALLCGGHVLVEGVPGTGKTLLVRTLGEVLHLPCGRIQFTVDLMPADITGTRMVQESEGRRELVFVPGPVFTHLLLADEINRATPRTQSALLEAMAELQVTAGDRTYALAPPFFVIATLNPIEMEGTYPLPEAQLDRFLFKVRLPYPNSEELQTIIGRTTGARPPRVAPVFAAGEATERIQTLQRLVREVVVAPHIEAYAAAMVRATIPATSRFVPRDTAPLPPGERVERYVEFGSSPRGGQALLLGARVQALLAGRVSATYGDVDRVAVPALAHRLVLNYAAQADGVDACDIIAEIVERARRLHR